MGKLPNVTCTKSTTTWKNVYWNRPWQFAIPPIAKVAPLIVAVGALAYFGGKYLERIAWKDHETGLYEDFQALYDASKDKTRECRRWSSWSDLHDDCLEELAELEQMRDKSWQTFCDNDREGYALNWFRTHGYPVFGCDTSE